MKALSISCVTLGLLNSVRVTHLTFNTASGACHQDEHGGYTERGSGGRMTFQHQRITGYCCRNDQAGMISYPVLLNCANRRELGAKDAESCNGIKI